MATKPEAKEKTTEKKAKAETAEKAPKKTAKAAAEGTDTVKSERNKTKEVKAEKKHHHKHLERSEQHCEVKGCKREYRAKGYCNTHYRQWRQGAFGHRRYTACSSTSCFKPMGKNRHGFCEEHYQSYYVKGMAVAKPAEEAKPAKPAAAQKEAASA